MSSTTPTKARETAAGSTRLPSDAEMDVTAIFTDDGLGLELDDVW